MSEDISLSLIIIAICLALGWFMGVAGHQSQRAADPQCIDRLMAYEGYSRYTATSFCEREAR